MTAEIRSAIDFYERHPISSQIILAKLKASRGHLNDVAPEELFPHDQDHYGGLDANDALAQRAGIGKGTRVVDFCAGLGGPARYLACRYGADVTGIEVTPARVKGAEELTRLVGLQENVRIIEGNVLRVPLPDGCGRDASYLAPPAQIRTCSFPAYGSYLESLTAMLRLGQGWRIRGRGSHSFISLVI